MDADSNLVGTTLNGFEVIELIGRGGMGVVYKARDTKLDRLVAIKLMDPLLARDAAFMKRFWLEAKALARLQNPNIVTVYSLLETEHGVCIVMEYVKGETLADIIKQNGALPPQRVLNLFDQILLAFEHAHGAGIVHRDVKPGNIMVTAEDVVKVTDFGLAKIYQSASATVTTLSGGTLFYAPPEQVEGLGNVDHRGDIYSIGMTMYESLTGVVPFGDAESDFGIREKIVRGKIPPPKSLHPALHPELNAVVMKAIQKDPANRFQSATKMRQALDEISIPQTSHSSATRTRTEPTPPPKPLLRYAIGALALVVLLALGYFLKPVLFPEEATVSVHSTPVGAAVALNGKGVGQTPLRDFETKPGRLAIRVSKPEYLPVDTLIFLGKGESAVLSISLAQEMRRDSLLNGTGQKDIVKEGEGKSTLGEKKGTSKLKEDLAAKKKREELARLEEERKHGKGGTTSQKNLTHDKQLQGKDIVTPAECELAVESNPPGATVWVDQTRVDRLPYRVVAGEHSVRVVAGTQEWSKRVVFAAGQNVRIPVDFRKHVAVSITAFDTEGQPVRAKIFVDGVQHAQPTPAEVTPTIGLHTFAVQREGYEAPPAKIRNLETDLKGSDALKFILRKVQ